MPKLRDLYTKYKDQGLVLIGVHTTSAAEKGRVYVSDEAIEYPVAFDVQKKTTTAFRVDSYPDYYLVDRAGNLRVADLANGDLERAVQILLRESGSEGSE